VHDPKDFIKLYLVKPIRAQQGEAGGTPGHTRGTQGTPEHTRGTQTHQGHTVGPPGVTWECRRSAGRVLDLARQSVSPRRARSRQSMPVCSGMSCPSALPWPPSHPLVPWVLQAAKQEAGAAFGNDGVYLEKAIIKPRHVEFQVSIWARARSASGRFPGFWCLCPLPLP